MFGGSPEGEDLLCEAVGMPRLGILVAEVRIVSSFVTNSRTKGLLNPKFKALCI